MSPENRFFNPILDLPVRFPVNSPKQPKARSSKLTPLQKSFIEALKRIKALKRADNKPVFSDWESLADKDFCNKMFDVEYAVLKEGAAGECKKESPNWAAIVGDVDEEFLLEFQNWESSLCASGIHVTVSVGYAWDSQKDVRDDEFWCSLRDILTATTKKLQEFYEGLNVFINVKRLRASHGGLINTRIVEYIENSDVLVFDVAGRKSRKYTEGYNANVLYELGQAMARKEPGKIFLWKPEKLPVPSDLSCYLWTNYKLEKEGGKLTRTLVDRRGFSAQFRSVLVECIRQKLCEREKALRGQSAFDSLQ